MKTKYNKIGIFFAKPPGRLNPHKKIFSAIVKLHKHDRLPAFKRIYQTKHQLSGLAGPW